MASTVLARSASAPPARFRSATPRLAQATAPVLQRLERTNPGTAVFAPIAINGLAAPECYTYLRYLSENSGTPPCELDLGGAGRVKYAAGDDNLLRARMAQDLPNVVAQLQGLLAGDQSELTARNMTMSAADASQLVATIRGNNAIQGFEDWLLSSAAKWIPRNANPGEVQGKRAARIDQINELREAQKVLAGGAQTANIAEAGIPGTASQTADVTAAGGQQTEVKTVRVPIRRPTDLNGQVGAACAKFSGATAADNRAVVYGSYDPVMLATTGAAGAHTVAADGKLTRHTPVGAQDAGHIWGNLVTQVPHMPGHDKLAEVVVRMENGPSFRVVQAQGTWTGALI